MADLHISNRAASDLAAIADYTIAEFGIEQARKYQNLFNACFQSLRDNPFLGRSVDELGAGLRQIRQQAHVIFYLPTGNEVLIVRVLHQSMDFERYL